MAGLPAHLQARLTDRARRIAHRIFATVVYRLTLIGRQPGAPEFMPADPWPGDPARGEALVNRLATADERGTGAIADIWSANGDSDRDSAVFHGFAWLRDLRAVGGDDARRAARQMVDDWIARNRRWSLPAWRSDVLAARLVAWFSHYETFFASGDEAFRRRLLASISRQFRHLERAWPIETRGAARITAIKGLVFGALCLGRRDLSERALSRLRDELERQVLPDGGHVERNPGALATVLRDLIVLRSTLSGGKREVPEELQQAIDRIGPMLRFLRHGDGALARFNCASGASPPELPAVFEQANGSGKPAARAPAAGFERLAAGGLLVLADSDAPPAPPYDHNAHTGTFAIEVSVGAERMIVGCGAPVAGRDRWHDAYRATAAHSTVVVNNRNSSALAADGRIGRRRATTTVAREVADGATLVDMRHDGYVASDGVTHRRRLYLSAEGDDFRGEDILTGPAGLPFAVRFHLHPAVSASPLNSGRAALLKLPRGGVWRLRGNAPMELAESIYFEQAPDPRRTSQIVIAGTTDEGTTTIKWALRREGK